MRAKSTCTTSQQNKQICNNNPQGICAKVKKWSTRKRSLTNETQKSKRYSSTSSTTFPTKSPFLRNLTNNANKERPPAHRNLKANLQSELNSLISLRLGYQLSLGFLSHKMKIKWQPTKFPARVRGKGKRRTIKIHQTCYMMKTLKQMMTIFLTEVNLINYFSFHQF
jgi:hypothetical protein